MCQGRDIAILDRTQRATELADESMAIDEYGVFVETALAELLTFGIEDIIGEGGTINPKVVID